MGLRRTLASALSVSLAASALPTAAQGAPHLPTAAEPAASPPSAHGNADALDAAPPEAPPQAALDHYLKGRQHYLAGRYRDALAELKAAHELDASAPDLLYNIARVYENLGELDQAIEYYQRYLALIPLSTFEERDETEKTIRRLQGAKREVRPRKASAAMTDVAPDRDVATAPAGRADLVFWITSGAALALFAGGATSGALAIHRYNQVGDFVVGSDGSLDDRQSLSDAANRFALIADGLFIGGGVALTAAALLFLLREAEPPEPAERAGMLRLDMSGSPDQPGLSVSGRF